MPVVGCRRYDSRGSPSTCGCQIVYPDISLEIWYIHHDFPGVNWQVRIVKRPVELLLCCWLICRVVIRRQILMCQTRFRRNPFLRIKDKHSLEKINRYGLSDIFFQTFDEILTKRVGIFEFVGQRLARSLR